MKKRIFVFLTSLCMMCCMMLMPVQVSAYTSIDGYPFVYDGFKISVIYRSPSTGIVGQSFLSNMTEKEQNAYVGSMNDFYSQTNLIRFGDVYSSYVIPVDNELYDYYCIGTFSFAVDSDDKYDFEIGEAVGWVVDSEDNVHQVPYSDLVSYDYVGNSSIGKSFSFKLDLSQNSNMPCFDLRCTEEYGGYVPLADLWFSASIVPVKKNTEADQLNQAILEELIKINQNLVSLQSLQQQTIDAIREHDTNEKSWFQQLIQSMGIGFSTLYEQMTKEQDEQLNGYEDTTTSEANAAFSSESDRLTTLESELSGISNQYISDYTAEGFDLGILVTLSSTFSYIATWFANFWNMGGIFTKGINFCLALSIAFTILRLR